ncbi:hypothetical protein B0H11DRAFT_2030747 [Mycena galericulata]|nr:hypothetical protein B0H11DRAFT_2030747 [Mycena galericulata]
MVLPFLPRLSLVRVSLVTALLVCLVFFLDPFKAPPVYGPVTLEEHFAALVPEAFAHYREFERLQELYHPAILTMTRKWNSDPDGPILLDIEVRYPDEPVYENDDDIDIVNVNVNDDDNDKDDDASRTHRAVPVTEEPTTTPRPGAFPRSRRPPSTSPLLVFICLAVSMMTAGTLVVCARLRCKVACCAARQVAPRPALATRPRVKSSGETRRGRAFPLQRRRKFRPSLPSIAEHPIPCSCACLCAPQAPSTSEGAAFIGVPESLAREQRDDKCKETAAPVETNSKPLSTHSRAHTDGNTGTKSSTVAPRSRTRTAPSKLPGPRSSVEILASPVPPPSSSMISLSPSSVPSPLPSATIGEIIYETPRANTSSVVYKTSPLKTPSSVLYETPADNYLPSAILYETSRAPPAFPALIYATSGSRTPLSVHTSSVPDHTSLPTRRTSGIVFHGRSNPPSRPLGHQNALPANLPAHDYFAHAQRQPLGFQSHPATYHHPHLYLLGVAQARAPCAW